jgi:hypothetical protein
MKLPSISLPFFLGFTSSLIIFAFIFIIDFRHKFDGMCFDCDNDFGWPFRVYQSGGLIHATKILWDGVLANALVVVLVGILLGTLFQFIYKSMDRFRSV